MATYHSNKSDFEKKSYLSPQQPVIEKMLTQIDDAGATVQAEGLSHLYVAQGDAVLGAGKTSYKFTTAVARIESMLDSAARIHEEVLQSIDSKLVKGIDEAFLTLNNVNGKDNPYKTTSKYSRTRKYTKNAATQYQRPTQETITTQEHYTLDEILDFETSPIQAVRDTYAKRVKGIRAQLAQSDKLSAEKIKEIEGMSDKELIENFYPRLKAENEYSKIKGSTFQEVNKETLAYVDLGTSILATVAMIGGVVLAPFTGGTSLYVTYAAGIYLAGNSAYSAITGNTLITGDRLSGPERAFAGVEAATTILTLGGVAAASGGLKSGSQAAKVFTTLGNVADKTDNVMAVTQLGYGIATGEPEAALASFVLGKGVEVGSQTAFDGIARHLSTPQVQQNFLRGQEFMHLQTAEFRKIASNVENNITIKMMVDGVEQKIRVNAIGFDEAGNIRIQEYTTAQNGLKISRQELLESLSKYGGTIVGAGKGEFVGGVEIPKGTRIDVISQKTASFNIDAHRIELRNTYEDAGLSTKDINRIFEISDNAPKAQYLAGISSDEILAIPKGDRPSVEDVYSPAFIEAHKQQFENGAIKIQRFTPVEGGFNNGAIGSDKDHVAFVMPKDVGETIIDISNGDPRVLEVILGLHPGDLGDSPVVIDIPVDSIHNLKIPSGNEASAFEEFWRPGGKTYPGGMPEAVIDEVPWGEYTFRTLGGN